MHLRPHPLLSAALGAIAACAPALAQAAPCSDLPNPVYGLGGSAQEPLVGKLGAALAGLTPSLTVVYNSSKGACSGINGLYGDNPTKLEGTAKFWPADGGPAQTCELPLQGETATWGTLGNSATECPDIPAVLPSYIRDFRGPVTSVNLFVPTQSTQQSISSEAVYLLYGLGAAGQVSPWTDETVLIRRNENSFVQIFLSIAAGVPVNKFKGVDAATNQNSINLVAAAPDKQKSIGFASGAVVDANRATVRTLAYQQKGQSCGYWPDSTADSTDKANVRSGLYYLWAQLHFYARVNGSGVIADANTKKLIEHFTDTGDTSPELDLTKIAIDGGTIPTCAMRAKREGDLGAISSYAPPNPCFCYFDKIVSGTSACTACTTDAQCSGTEKCRNQLCEAY